LGIVAAVVLAVFLADQAGAEVLRQLGVFWAEPIGKGFVAIGLVGLCVVIWRVTVIWVSRAETYKLLE
jgi:hypothetical protein